MFCPDFSPARDRAWLSTARRAWRTFEARVLLPLAFVLAAPLIAAGGFVAAEWLWTHTHWSLAATVFAIAVADTLFALAAAAALAMERV